LIDENFLYNTFEKLVGNAKWKSYKTKTSHRFVDSIEFSTQYLISRIECELELSEDALSKAFVIDDEKYRHLTFLHPLLILLKDVAEKELESIYNSESSSESNSKVIPIQCFICYYPTGSNSCPNHTHNCRQLTLSLGCSRWFNCFNDNDEFRSYLLRNGDVAFVEGNRHGVSVSQQNTHSYNDSDIFNGGRVSINLFYATVADILAGGVTVNKQGRNIPA